MRGCVSSKGIKNRYYELREIRGMKRHGSQSAGFQLMPSGEI